MLDKAILEHKKSYLVSLKKIFFRFLEKIVLQLKNHKKLKFENRPNMTFYGIK